MSSDHRARRRLIKKLWRWSLAITMPLAICFTLWIQATVSQYYDFGVRLGKEIKLVTLYETGNMELSFLISRMLRPFRRTQIFSDNKAKELETIHLFIKKNKLKRLNSNLPYSGFKYKKAQMYYDGKLRPVKLKYRGDNFYHWAFSKKSMRIKTRPKNMYKGIRSFNLITPKMYEQVNSYFSYILANEMQLIAPHAEMVNVNINGQPSGMFLLVEQIGESTLRRNNLMPGDIYSGEILGRDRYIGAMDNLFYSHSLWEKVAVNNHYEDNNRAPLEKLISMLKLNQDTGTAGELSAILDMKQWGRFSAFETLTQTKHYDGRHNWRIYYDPARGKFIPIAWDTMGWYRGMVEQSPTDIIKTNFHYALFQNADFLRERQRAFEEFYALGTDKKVLAKMDSMLEAITAAAKTDPFIVISEIRADLMSQISETETPDTWPGYPFRHASGEEIAAATVKLRNTIETVFGRIKKEITQKGKLSYEHNGDIIKLELKHRRNAENLRLTFDKAIPTELQIKIRSWLNNNTIEKDISAACSFNENEITIHAELLPEYNLITINDEEPLLTVRPAYYELEIHGLPPEAGLTGIEVDFGTGEFIQAIRSEGLTQKSMSTMHRAIAHVKDKNPLIWEGEHEVNGFTRLDRNLTINPGTTIRMSPNATLLLTGAINVKGTPSRPVKFIPAKADKPWGAIVLSGHGADNSTVTYAEFSGGSGYKDDISEYSAMLSIHNVDSVEIAYSSFRDNHKVDDMVHAVYSSLTIKQSTFDSALADCLDLDISEARIEATSFNNCGNDSVDLMTTTLMISNSAMVNSGDKGISVGEKSTLLAINNLIKSSHIAVQAKDDSVATLYNMDMLDNNQAIDAYQKNLQYNTGGTVYFHKGRIEGNKLTAKADNASLIRLYDSYIDDISAIKQSKKIFVDSTVDGESRFNASIKKFIQTEEEIKRNAVFKENDWRKANPEIRGASGF